MSLDLLKQQAQHDSRQQPEELPAWVSLNNKSIEAWRCLQILKTERQAYIKTHRRPSDFSKSSLWQIRASNVASVINAKPATLDPVKGSKWASGFRDALDDTNKKLLKEKEKRVKTYLSNKAKGNASKTHDELLKKCQQLEKELQSERRKNAEQAWTNRIAELSLPVKQVLGLND